MRIISAAFSPIIMTGALVFPETMAGMRGHKFGNSPVAMVFSYPRDSV